MTHKGPYDSQPREGQGNSSHGREPVVDVVIVRTGIANLASVMAGLSRAGAAPRLTDDPAEVAAAGRVVLPGVGAFGAAMELLAPTGLGAAVAERIRAGRPTLCVCLGLQLLFRQSEESPGVRGLVVVDGSVNRFTGAGGVRVPQLGWNRVEPSAGCRLLEPGYAYFANSFKAAAVPEGWHAAVTHHGEPFVAAFERGAVLACQFHPELSGAWGLALLRRWLSWSAAANASRP